VDTGIPRRELCSVWSRVGTSSEAGRLFLGIVSRDGCHRVVVDGMALGQDRCTPHLDHAGERQRSMFILFRLADRLSGLPCAGVGALYAFTAIGDSPILSSTLTQVVSPPSLGAALGFRSLLGFGAGASAPLAFGMVLDYVNALAGTRIAWDGHSWCLVSAVLSRSGRRFSPERRYLRTRVPCDPRGLPSQRGGGGSTLAI